MRKVQLYINDQRADLFDDEIISLTQTIKNVQDVSKVFTDFSKTFTVPASKTNNKIFEHYYNYHIANSFDARTKAPSSIEINDVPYRTGRVRLEGVELRNNKPYSYRITFFGNTVTLKDLMGEETLSALTGLDAFNAVYDAEAIKAALQANPSTEHLIAPLITHSQRLYYDSSDIEVDTGNLYWDATYDNRGVSWKELKYAIRVHKVVEAIGDKYGFTFSDDFFSTTNPPYYNLFLWLHRNKGNVTTVDQIQDYTKLISGWATSDDANSTMLSNTFKLKDASITTNLTLNAQVSGAITSPYNISVTRNGEEIFSQSGINTANYQMDLLYAAQSSANYQVTIGYSDEITFSNFTWTTNSSLGENIYNSGTIVAQASFEFIITEQVPDIKVIDLLTGLFKMFNLTAVVSDSNVITVKTLDVFYDEGNSVTITPYIDINSYEVNSSIPYKEISFQYKDTKSFLAANHNKLTGSDWGKESYNSPDNIREGEKFTVEVPFSHFKYENLIDLSTSGSVDIQWGYSVDDNQESYIGSPLVFYPVLQAQGGISFVDEVAANGSFSIGSEITAAINMPSNSLYFDPATGVQNINFKYEKNEFTRGDEFTGTLFSNYYINYIASVFSRQRRISKFKAQLPVSFLTSYSLADTIIISDREYRINSITTNLNTGESDLELLNIVNAFFEVPAGEGGNGGETPGTLTVSVSGQTQPIEETTHTYNATVTGGGQENPTYSWSVSNGTINGSNTNSAVSITWNAVNANSPGSVTCTATKGNLTPESNTLVVTIQNYVAAFEIEITENGSTQLLPKTEGDTPTYGLDITGDTTGISYGWGIDGGTIDSGLGTTSVDVTWTTPGTGNINVTAFRNGTDFAGNDSEDVTVNAASAPTFGIAITNVTESVLEGSVITYGTTDSGTATGAISYTWTVIGGSFTNQGTSSIIVTWSTPGAGSVRVDAIREGVDAADQDPISVTALQTTATITGDFSSIVKGNSRSYGSTIGGNTSGTVTYSWSASGGTITSGQGTANVDVLWSTVGTGTLSLTATREGRSGFDSDSLTVLPIYYIFNACDGGTTVIDQLTTPPSATNQRYIDFSTSPAEYYTYSGSTQNDSSGYPVVDLQAATPFATGCPAPEPTPPSELSITGATDISGSGQSGVQYTLNVDPNTVSWQLTDAALEGFNPIDITFVTSTSGTGDSTFSVNFGVYTGNGSETLRSQITATELNPTAPNPASVGSITISQSPPPTATLNVYARANLVTASRTFEYSTGGAYTPIATANITQSCVLIGTVTGITPGATVTLITSPTNELLGNNSSSCPGSFTSPSGATTYSITVAAGTNNVALNVDTVAGTFALTTGRSLVDGASACSRYNSGFTGTTYADESSIFASTALFADVNGYTYASAGWYSDGIDFKYWDGTSFTSSGVCS
jgi:hypothetical protein